MVYSASQSWALTILTGVAEQACLLAAAPGRGGDRLVGLRGRGCVRGGLAQPLFGAHGSSSAGRVDEDKFKVVFTVNSRPVANPPIF